MHPRPYRRELCGRGQPTQVFECVPVLVGRLAPTSRFGEMFALVVAVR